MNRKEFIHQCGSACLGAIGLPVLTVSCMASRRLNAPINSNNQLQVPLAAFVVSSKNNKSQYRRYVIVENDGLNYPIVVYRHAADDYTALLLPCSHQYNELNVNGDLLTCPANGSEFHARGEDLQCHAEDKLRFFMATRDARSLLLPC